MRGSWGDIKYLTRDLRDNTKEIDRIKVREKDISSDLEGTILDLLEAQKKLNNREF